MSKITKSLAKEIAEIICRKAFTEKVKGIEKEIKDYCSKLAEQTIESDIVKFFSKYPDYVRTRSYFNFVSGGLEPFGVYTNYIPSKESSCYRTIEVSRDEYEQIRSKHENKRQLNSDHDLLFTQIESTLVSLGTFKRVEEQFPEAAIYLPKASENQTTVIALPIQDIRGLLNKYN
jgi:hypothetical protein